MPLSAKFENSEINIIDYSENLNVLKNKVFCKYCHSLFLIKNGKIKIPHFAHKNRCECEYSGESFQHILFKSILYKYFKNINNEISVELEKKLKVCKPDLLVKTKKCNIGCEVQISQELDIIKRSISNYYSDNIYSLWVFAPKKRKWFISGEGMYDEHTADGKFSICDIQLFKSRYELTQKEIDVFNVINGLFVIKKNKLIFLKLENVFPRKYHFSGDYKDPKDYTMYSDMRNPFKKIKMLSGFSIVNYKHLIKNKLYPLIGYDYANDENFIHL